MQILKHVSALFQPAKIASELSQFGEHLLSQTVPSWLVRPTQSVHDLRQLQVEDKASEQKADPFFCKIAGVVK